MLESSRPIDRSIPKSLPEESLPELRQLTNLAVIQAIYAALDSAPTLDARRRIYR